MQLLNPFSVNAFGFLQTKEKTTMNQSTTILENRLDTTSEHNFFKRQAGIFTLLVMTLAVGISLQPQMIAFYMFTPTIAALLTLLLTGQIKKSGWFKSLGITSIDFRNWPKAILLPIFILLPGYLFVYLTGRAQIGIPFTGLTWLNMILNYLVLLIFNTLTFSLGEEIGWRGFLLPRLLHLGKVRANLLTGVIWSLWHYPLIFLTDIYINEGNRLLLTLLFTLTVIGISLVIGQLWQSKRSVWVASLFHSSHNVTWQLLDSITVNNPAVLYLAGESGLIPLVLYLVVGFLFIKKDQKFTPENVN